MDKLRELTRLNYELLQLIENDELDEQTISDSLEILKFEVEAEGNQIVAYHRSLDAEIEKNKNIAKQYTEYAKKLEIRKERLRNFITSYMKSTNTKVINTDFAKISFRKSKATDIYDESLLPEDCFIIDKKPSKAKVREKLDKGEEVQGARIIENENLQIR